jgi:hypothetical protein
MKKATIICFGLVGLISQVVVGQNKLQSLFYRPTISNIFSSTGVEGEKNVIELFKFTTKVPERFNTHEISTTDIKFTRPEKPVLPEELDVLALKKTLNAHKQQLIQYDETISRGMSESLRNSAREMVAFVWNRDASGNFDFYRLEEMAEYSSSDNDFLVSNMSADQRKIFTEISDSLLNRNYLFVYEITKVQTYEEYYNEQDAKLAKAAAKSGTATKPVVRNQEGWLVDYDFFAYQLDWSDSLEAVFYEELWLSVDDSLEVAKKKREAKAKAETTKQVFDKAYWAAIEDSLAVVRRERTAKFNNFDFPLKQVFKFSGSTIKSQSNNPKFYESPLAPRRKSMDELLSEIPDEIQNESIFQASKVIDDFKTKAPLYKEYPLRVKLGKKEGVYFDQRFYAYRMLKKQNGKDIKKRVGVLRPSFIIDNPGVSKGNTPPSVFVQQGGKRLYGGDLIEMNEDRGIGFNLGFTGNDHVNGGVYAGLELRVSSLYNKPFTRGLFLTGNVTINYSGNQQFFADTLDRDALLKTKTPQATAVGLSVGIAKETYFTKKGNIYITPEIGAGLLSVLVAKDTTPVISYSSSSWFVYAGFRLGVHLSPSLSLFAFPTFNYRLGYGAWVDQSDEVLSDSVSLTSKPDSYKFKQEWGFDGEAKLSIPICVGFRMKF